VLSICSDNPETDIYGGNLYNQYLRRRNLQRELQRTRSEQEALSIKRKLRMQQSDGEYISDDEGDGKESVEATVVPVLDSLGDEEEEAEKTVKEVAKKVVVEKETNGGVYTEGCESILVCTGVFSEEMDLFNLQSQRPSNHNHRDFVINPELKKPHHVVPNVLEAVRLVFKQEGADVSILENNVRV
jgi:hypothetical protein